MDFDTVRKIPPKTVRQVSKKDEGPLYPQSDAQETVAAFEYDSFDLWEETCREVKDPSIQKSPQRDTPVPWPTTLRQPKDHYPHQPPPPTSFQYPLPSPVRKPTSEEKV